MTYTIIGSGNMAWFLTNRLQQAGFRCMGVYGRNRTEVSLLSESVNAPIFHHISHIREGLADCCIIAVADQAIAEVAAKLPLTETVVIHTAGSLALDVIPTHNSAALWCIYSILKNDLPTHRNIPVICESGSPKAAAIVHQFANAVSDIVQTATWQQRQYLHLTAVLSNNFINHLLTITSELCKQQQISFELLQPIIEQTFQRLQSTDPKDMQSGPARRGDRNTIQRHLLLLQQQPHWKYLYECVSASIENMYMLKDRMKNG